MSLFKSKSVPSLVGDEQVQFYSLSLPVLFSLKSAFGPVAKVLSGFFAGTKQLVGRFQEDSVDPAGNPVRVVQVQPISPELAKLRSEQSAKLAQEAIDAIFADHNRMLLGRVLMDSMRDRCPRRPDPKQIEEFLEQLDVCQAVEMLQGVAKANVEVFGPLGRDWATKATDLLRAQASSGSPTSADSEPQKPPAPQLVPKD